MCVGILKNISLGNAQNLSDHAGLPLWKINLCLKLLQKNLLIKNDGTARGYMITEKGIQYLKSYSKIIELLSFKLEKREEIIA